MKKVAHSVWLVSAYIVLLLGCAGIVGTERKKPGVIAVRNMSGNFIASVTITASKSADSPQRRFGTFSPLPPGVTQLFYRQESSRPLPQQLQIFWTLQEPTTYSREIEITDIPEGYDLKGYAVVIEFLPNQHVHAYYEQFFEENYYP